MSTDSCSMVTSSNTSWQLGRINITLFDFHSYFLFYLQRELSSTCLKNVSEIWCIIAHLCCLLYFTWSVFSLMRRKVTHPKLSQTKGDFPGHLNSFWPDVIVHFLAPVYLLCLSELSTSVLRYSRSTSVSKKHLHFRCVWLVVTYSTVSGFLNLSTVDILGPIILCWGRGGAVPCIVGCLAASRVSIDYAPEARAHTHPSCDN